MPSGLKTQTSAARVQFIRSVVLRDLSRAPSRMKTRAVRPLAGGRRSVQGRKAQNRRTCLTGRF